MAMQKEKKTQRVIFFGDSITEAAVNEGGYIKQLQNKLEKLPNATNYHLIGAGVSGNKVYDLYLRLEEDVLKRKPSIVVIYVGINDVWHKQSSHTGTDLDKFEKFYTAIIKKIQAQNSKVIVCTPTMIGEKKNATNEMDKELDLYAAEIRQISKRNNCKLVDLRQAFTDYLRINNPQNSEEGILTTDGVHLNNAGNKLVADEMSKILGW